MHRRQGVDETVVGGEAPLVHGNDVSVKGIEPLRRARLAGGRLAHQARRLPRGLARCQFNVGRCLLEARDQTLQLALDRADAGGVLLNAAKLLAYIADLPLDLPQILELRRLGEGSLEAGRNLLHAHIQPVDRRGRHRIADRALESLRHFDQAPVGIGIALAGRREVDGRAGVAGLIPGQERGALGVGEVSFYRGIARLEPVWLGAGEARLHGADFLQGLVQGLSPFGRRRLLEPPRKPAQLKPQALQRLALFRGCKRFGDACGVRHMA